MVFRSKGKRTFKCRVDHPDHRHGELTTGCVTEEDALEVEGQVRRWEGRKGKRYERLDVIDALLAKRVTLPDAYEAAIAGTLEQLLAVHAAPDPATGVDLAPMLAGFADRKRNSGKGAGQADTYLKQLGVLFPERPFLLSRFTLKETWARLDALEVDPPTRNRYRTAAAWLAKSLVREQLLERNFVRDIDGYGENPKRLVYYEHADARTLLAGLAQPYAAIAALGLGFAAEWGAVVRARVGDLAITSELVTMRVRGSKRVWRDRVVPLVPQLRWILDYLAPAIDKKLPAAPIIDGVPEWRAIDVQRETARALEVTAVGEEEFGEHSLHDWRHTHAVALLRWGYLEQIAADHLGHKDTSLIRTTYGRFKPTVHDYAKVAPAPESTTHSTAPVRKHVKRRAVK